MIPGALQAAPGGWQPLHRALSRPLLRRKTPRGPAPFLPRHVRRGRKSAEGCRGERGCRDGFSGFRRGCGGARGGDGPAVGAGLVPGRGPRREPGLVLGRRRRGEKRPWRALSSASLRRLLPPPFPLKGPPSLAPQRSPRRCLRPPLRPPAAPLVGIAWLGRWDSPFLMTWKA